MLHRFCYIISIFFGLRMQLVSFSGCVKEYSYEGGNVIIDTIPNDTIPDDTIVNKIIFPICFACDGKDDYLLSTWNFKYDTSFLCGNITRAVITPEHNAFTFFGPSACSLDTGLVMTVYLSAPMVGDASNITAQHVIFKYYNNKGTQDIFASIQVSPFSLVIDSYSQSTGVAKGRFSGYTTTDRQDTALIKDGKFEIHFD